MANEVSAMISDQGHVFGGTMASGSVVAGDLVAIYQSGTDDQFATNDATTYTTGSVGLVRMTGATTGMPAGIALQDAASGDRLSVATEGFFLINGNTSTAGVSQMPVSATAVADLPAASGAGHGIGRALTGASTTAKPLLLKLNI